MSKNICLFTAHSPTSGGGAVNLRTIIEYLPELNVQWKYIASQPAKNYETGYMGKGFMGGPIIRDIFKVWQMLSNRRVNEIDEIVNELMNVDCDAYWIVSHNEGLRVALELSRLQNKRPVHLTIHDDWTASLCAKSVRYRLMQSKAHDMTIKVLKHVKSADFTSKGMQQHYLNYGIKGGVSHRYLPPESIGDYNHISNKDVTSLYIGHIGSIYDINDFIVFLGLLKVFEEKKGIKVTVNMWGFHIGKDVIPEQYMGLLNIHNDLAEDQVVPLLAGCHLVYAMYPSVKRLRKFTQTSFPTKLSSYIRASTPIFGHGPDGCTLEEFLHNTSTGVIWKSGNIEDGIFLLEKAISLSRTSMDWKKARAEYFGENNLATVRNAFLSNN